MATTKVYNYTQTYVAKDGTTRTYTQNASRKVTSTLPRNKMDRMSDDDIRKVRTIYERLNNMSATSRFCKFENIDVSPFVLKKLIVSDRWNV